ncbi:hypothetical protein TNCV_2994951 [Trichonephila clavipes]|nr:hypothetical protein TNCV_2994951 [Trichonephila clavipes]
MVWTSIMLDCRTHLHVFERGTITLVRHRDEFLEPCVRLFTGAQLALILFTRHIVAEFLESLWFGREKKKEKWDDKKMVENREGSLGYPGFVAPMLTKDSKPLEKRKRSLGHLEIMTPVLT